tara:strand:+ start:279 stop:1022 length:744 start_codon:yes stop_codon:yes gene_type:complete
MDYKEIKGKFHYLYDNLKEFKAKHPDITPERNWREGREGEWVFTDDMNICQILKIYYLKDISGEKRQKVVRTVCGSFVCSRKNTKMIGANGVAENIYRFSGKNRNNKLPNERIFARYVAAGIGVTQAYSMTYPKAESENYIKTAAQKLMKQENVQNMVTEEIKAILEEEGVTPEYIIGRYKDIADIGERDSDRLRSLDSLAKIAGLFDTEKKSEQLTVWQGFTPEQLEKIKNEQEIKLVGHAESEKK